MLGVVDGDGVGELLEDRRLAGLGRRDDEAALTLADGAQQVHDARRRVVLVGLEAQTLLGEQRRELLEHGALARGVRVHAVDAVDLEQRVVLLVVLGLADLAGDLVAAAQAEAPDLAEAHVHVAVALGEAARAQEPEAVREYVQDAGARDGRAVVALLLAPASAAALALVAPAAVLALALPLLLPLLLTAALLLRLLLTVAVAGGPVGGRRLLRLAGGLLGRRRVGHGRRGAGGSRRRVRGRRRSICGRYRGSGRRGRLLGGGLLPRRRASRRRGHCGGGRRGGRRRGVGRLRHGGLCPAPGGLGRLVRRLVRGRRFDGRRLDGRRRSYVRSRRRARSGRSSGLSVQCSWAPGTPGILYAIWRGRAGKMPYE